MPVLFLHCFWPTTRLNARGAVHQAFWLGEEAIPVLRTADAALLPVAWYSRSGYDQEWEHRFEPGFPAFRLYLTQG